MIPETASVGSMIPETESKGEEITSSSSDVFPMDPDLPKLLSPDRAHVNSDSTTSTCVREPQDKRGVIVLNSGIKKCFGCACFVRKDRKKKLPRHLEACHKDEEVVIEACHKDEEAVIEACHKDEEAVIEACHME